MLDPFQVVVLVCFGCLFLGLGIFLSKVEFTAMKTRQLFDVLSWKTTEEAERILDHIVRAQRVERSQAAFVKIIQERDGWRTRAERLEKAIERHKGSFPDFPHHDDVDLKLWKAIEIQDE